MILVGAIVTSLNVFANVWLHFLQYSSCWRHWRRQRRRHLRWRTSGSDASCWSTIEQMFWMELIAVTSFLLTRLLKFLKWQESYNAKIFDVLNNTPFSYHNSRPLRKITTYFSTTCANLTYVSILSRHMDPAVYILSKYVFNLNCLFTWLQIRSVTHIKTFIQVIEKVLGKPENSLVKFNAWRIKVQEHCLKINVVRKGLNKKVVKDKIKASTVLQRESANKKAVLC